MNVQDLQASLERLKEQEERRRDASVLADAALLEAKDAVAKVCRMSQCWHFE